jgi:integrase
VRGRRTAANYLSQLRPVPAARKRWPLAVDIDRAFAVELRAHLHRYQTMRNGRPGGRPKALSGRQVVNVLECLRSVLSWARRAEVRELPAEWANPLTHDLVGAAPAKDPLREDQLPLAARVRLAGAMDRWQLCQLGPSLVLPMRPGEAAGLLIADVNFERGWLEFGHRLGDVNFTKAKTALILPFPDELRPALRACFGGRAEGPLLRGRTALEKGGGLGVASLEELRLRYEESLPGQRRDSVQSAHDRKRLFRLLLRRLGGVSEDELSKELKRLLARLSVGNGATFYTLRGSVTTALEAANLPHVASRAAVGKPSKIRGGWRSPRW